MIDAPHLPAQVGQSVGVDAPRPDSVAGNIVFFGPFAFQHRFGFAIAFLLLPIGEHRISAVMPHQGRRTEPQTPALFLQTPADIHVIASHVELRVETADSFKRHFAEGHVATRDMFRFPIREQHVDGAAGRMGDAIGDHAIARRRNVRAAHASVFLGAGSEEEGDQIVQPMGVRIGVVVDVGDDLTGGGFQPEVAGVAQAAIRLGDDPVLAVFPAGHRTAEPAIRSADDLEAQVFGHDHRVVG